MRITTKTETKTEVPLQLLIASETDCANDVDQRPVILSYSDI